jgi:hypothetical protein
MKQGHPGPGWNLPVGSLASAFVPIKGGWERIVAK